MAKMKADYFIVGNSAGGIGAAEAIREIDRQGSIVIVSDEPYHTYSRPLISKYLSGERGMDGILFRPEEFYDTNDITLISGMKVERLLPQEHLAKLTNADEIEWKKVLLATGGSPIVPNIKGKDKDGVFPFLTLDDARTLSQRSGSGKHALVIGGGLIGLSVSEALHKCNLDVTVIEMKDRVLNTILDNRAAAIVEEALTKSDIKVITGLSVTEIYGEASVEGVVLNNGEQIACDIVIMAIGVAPRIELAREAGIAVGRGIITDEHMRTSHADVFACGDAAEVYDPVLAQSRVIPIWPNAHIGGRVAGYNMTGREAVYHGSIAMNAVNYFGLAITTAGLIEPEDESVEVFSKESGSSYRKILVKDNHVTGMLFVNDINTSGIICNLIKEQVDVSEFKHKLIKDDFGLINLPRDMRNERLTHPYSQHPYAFADKGQPGSL